MILSYDKDAMMTDEELRKVLGEAKISLRKGMIVIPEKQKRRGVYEYKKAHEISWLADKGFDVLQLPDLICQLIEEIEDQGPAQVYCGTEPPTEADESAAYAKPMYPFSFYTLVIDDIDGEIYLKFALKKGYFIYLSLHQSIKGYG